MSNVIHAKFSAPPAEADASLRPVALAIQSVLVRHTGREVSVRPDRAAYVVAVDHPVYQFSVEVGRYNGKTIFDLRVSAKWLVDPTIAKAGVFGAEYADVEFESQAAVAAWVRKNCLRAPLDWVSDREWADWVKRTVCYDGKSFRLDKMAVRYGAEKGLSVTKLEEKGFSSADAEAIVDVIRKMALRKRHG